MKNEILNFIDYLENTMNNMSEEFLATDKFVEKTLTINLEGKSISFPIAYDTYEKLYDLLKIELDHQ